MSSYFFQDTKPFEQQNKPVGVRGRKSYVPGVREPYHLPDQTIRLPAPAKMPDNPPAFNWISIIPPVLMMAGMLILPMFTGQPLNLMYIVPMFATLAFPIANLANTNFLKRKYKKAIIQRKEDYRQVLERERARLRSIALEQRSILENEYPKQELVVDLALSKGARTRLWWRRPSDSDFLSLRVGLSTQNASFKVESPNFADPLEELAGMASLVVQEFKQVSDLPFLLNLKKIGSVGIASQQMEIAQSASWRLILDLLVHHSPSDVQLAVVSDTFDAAERWGLLKWAPHTRSLGSTEKVKLLNFNEGNISSFLDWLVEQYSIRSKAKNNDRGEDQTAIVVIFADQGHIRTHPDLSPVIARGKEVNIFTIFIGDRNLPRVHCRIDFSDQKNFRLVEAWEGGDKIRGTTELTSMETAEQVCRALAQLEILGDKTNYDLPESFRLSQVFPTPIGSFEDIKKNWSLNLSDRELLQFPMGITVSREGLEVLNLNLLPEDRGGIDAYHTVLVGTTGSGKSEFLKSLVLAAAVKYSPRDLNFFTLDFKGGSTFNRFKNLPHMVGVVDNLRPELAERGLDAIQAEIDHRLEKFGEIQVKDIWEYNKRSPQPMAHLLLVLDEFARGLKEFPEMQPILDLLVRQGRSLGMYLILANQEVTTAVDNLLSNIGWRIALKLGKQEEMSIISKERTNPKRAGHGYLRSGKGDVFEFQSGYAGNILQSSRAQSKGEFVIFQLEADGSRKNIYRHTNQPDPEVAAKDLITEQEAILRMVDQATVGMGIKQSDPIYSDPLPTKIVLSDLMQPKQQFRTFEHSKYSEVVSEKHQLKATVGFVDYISNCVQLPLEVSFEEQDTHLWIVGASGSGKSMTVKTILLSLAYTHTPEEVNFYILEFGGGDLKVLERMPHTGAVITSNERERIDRLFSYIEKLIDDRTAGTDDNQTDRSAFPGETKYATNADIIFVINNVGNLISINQDYVDKLARIVRNGKAAHIHLLITANQVRDLPKKVLDGIFRRMAFFLSQREEYTDALNQHVRPISLHAEGRGYWRNERIAECQIALPILTADEVDLELLETKNYATEQLYRAVEELHGMTGYLLPKPISAMPRYNPVSPYLRRLAAGESRSAAYIPMGLDYETLDPIGVSLLKEQNRWVILSPIQRGKSNFLALVANSLANLEPDDWDIYALTFRRNDLHRLLSPEAHKITKTAKTTDEVVSVLQQLKELFEQNELMEKRVLLLMDDLPGAFDTPTLVTVLEAFYNTTQNRPELFVMASGTREEMQTRHGVSQMVKNLKSNQTGMVFSNEGMDLDWLGISPQMHSPYRRLSFDEGGGFFARRGKIRPVKTFIANE